jgi:hypothetical protein
MRNGHQWVRANPKFAHGVLGLLTALVGETEAESEHVGVEEPCLLITRI